MLQNTTTILKLIQSLGLSYHDLVNEKIVPDLPLRNLYEDDIMQQIEPAAGLELSFWPETKRFEAFYISVLHYKYGGPDVYTGGLPAPFDTLETQMQVHSKLGEPILSEPSIKLMNHEQPLGPSDMYCLNHSIHPSAWVDFQYNEKLEIATIAFSLMHPES